MNKFIVMASAASTLAIVSAPAKAVTVLTPSPSARASIAGDYPVSDTFSNQLDVPGAIESFVDLTIQAAYLSAARNVTFNPTSLMNGGPFSYRDPMLPNEQLFRFNIPIMGGVTNFFNIAGRLGSRSKYTSPFSSTATAVPEPTSWALALLGFSMVGAALRARSARWHRAAISYR